MSKPEPRLYDGILLLGFNIESGNVDLWFNMNEPVTPIRVTNVTEQIPTPTWLFQGQTIVGEENIKEYYDRYLTPIFAGIY